MDTAITMGGRAHGAAGDLHLDPIGRIGPVGREAFRTRYLEPRRPVVLQAFARVPSVSTSGR